MFVKFFDPLVHHAGNKDDERKDYSKQCCGKGGVQNIEKAEWPSEYRGASGGVDEYWNQVAQDRRVDDDEGKGDSEDRTYQY